MKKKKVNTNVGGYNCN